MQKYFPLTLREVLRLKDGGEVALDWLEANERKDNPVAVVLPGLTGASDSVYVIGMVMSLHKMGISCAVLNSRGTGGMELKVRSISDLFRNDGRDIYQFIDIKGNNGM